MRPKNAQASGAVNLLMADIFVIPVRAVVLYGFVLSAKVRFENRVYPFSFSGERSVGLQDIV